MKVCLCVTNLLPYARYKSYIQFQGKGKYCFVSGGYDFSLLNKNADFDI